MPTAIQSVHGLPAASCVQGTGSPGQRGVWGQLSPANQELQQPLLPVSSGWPGWAQGSRQSQTNSSDILSPGPAPFFPILAAHTEPRVPTLARLHSCQAPVPGALMGRSGKERLEPRPSGSAALGGRGCGHVVGRTTLQVTRWSLSPGVARVAAPSLWRIALTETGSSVSVLYKDKSYSNCYSWIPSPGVNSLSEERPSSVGFKPGLSFPDSH